MSAIGNSIANTYSCFFFNFSHSCCIDIFPLLIKNQDKGYYVGYTGLDCEALTNAHTSSTAPVGSFHTPTVLPFLGLLTPTIEFYKPKNLRQNASRL